MEYLARVELGMSSKEFYDCPWYEWGLWFERINELRRKRLEDQELLIEMFRSTLCRYYNWNRGNNPEISPQDFWRLSYDDQTHTDHEPTEEEKLRLSETISRLESKSKRKRG